MKKTSKFEQDVLDIVLIELRRAMKLKRQFTIVIDPFLVGGRGANIFASQHETGHSYTVETK